MKSKCCESAVHTEVKGSQTGIYCNKCGKWLKWASKDDLRAIEINKVKPFTGELERPHTTDPFNIDKLKEEIKYYKDSIKRMMFDIDKTIEHEYDVVPLSPEDAIRKSSKCYELERVKFSLEQILESK